MKKLAAGILAGLFLCFGVLQKTYAFGENKVLHLSDNTTITYVSSEHYKDFEEIIENRIKANQKRKYSFSENVTMKVIGMAGALFGVCFTFLASTGASTGEHPFADRAFGLPIGIGALLGAIYLAVLPEITSVKVDNLNSDWPRFVYGPHPSVDIDLEDHGGAALFGDGGLLGFLEICDSFVPTWMGKRTMRPRPAFTKESDLDNGIIIIERPLGVKKYGVIMLQKPENEHFIQTQFFDKGYTIVNQTSIFEE